MNWDRIEGNWKQFKGGVKEQWGKLTDDDFDVVAGKRDKLAGRIQERYESPRTKRTARSTTGSPATILPRTTCRVGAPSDAREPQQPGRG